MSGFMGGMHGELDENPLHGTAKHIYKMIATRKYPKVGGSNSSLTYYIDFYI